MKIPPKLRAERPAVSSCGLLGGYVLGVTGVLLLACALVEGPGRAIEVPCGFRMLSGWPCPFCGGTRALADLAHGRWGHSLMLNPLVWFALLAVPVWWMLCVLESRGMISSERMDKLRPGWKFWSVAIALNWSYLCLARPC